MHRKIDRGREADKHAILQAVSQSGRQPCMQPSMHTYREREMPTDIYADRDIPRDTYRDRGT